MRIISGKYKGRRINPPKNLPVRPTTDMSKESLFNVLNNRFDFEGLKVLDLFAGTGNISFEFGSRGSDDITCVDEDFGCIKFIKQVAEEMDFNIAAIKTNAFTYVEKSSDSFDVIFADPPYHLEQDKLERLVKTVFGNNLLREEGMLIIEHSRHTKLQHMPSFLFQKNYGGSVFSFFGTEESEKSDESDDSDESQEEE